MKTVREETKGKTNDEVGGSGDWEYKGDGNFWLKTKAGK